MQRSHPAHALSLLCVALLAVGAERASATSPSGGQVAAPLFTFEEIGALGGAPCGFSNAYSLNRYGRVGGTSDGAPVVFDGAALVEALPVGGAVAEVSDHGVLIVNGNAGPYLARGGASRALPGLGGDTYAYSLNDALDAVGLSYRMDGVARPVLWRGYTAMDLGTLVPDVRGVTSDINDAGTVVGSSGDAVGNDRPVKWVGGQVVDLGTVDASTVSGIARAINDLGDIVGESSYSGPAGGGFVATAWWSDGTVQPLRFLDDAQPTSRAYDINDHGEIVGESVSRPFLWTRGQMYDLNDVTQLPPNWHLLEARAINNRGQIVGTGFAPCGSIRGVLLTPAN